MLAVTEPDDAYELHMNLIAHGRARLQAEAALRRVRPAADVHRLPGGAGRAGRLIGGGRRSARPGNIRPARAQAGATQADDQAQLPLLRSILRGLRRRGPDLGRVEGGCRERFTRERPRRRPARQGAVRDQLRLLPHARRGRHGRDRRPEPGRPARRPAGPLGRTCRACRPRSRTASKAGCPPASSRAATPTRSPTSSPASPASSRRRPTRPANYCPPAAGSSPSCRTTRPAPNEKGGPGGPPFPDSSQLPIGLLLLADLQLADGAAVVGRPQPGRA